MRTGPNVTLQMRPATVFTIIALLVLLAIAGIVFIIQLTTVTS